MKCELCGEAQTYGGMLKVDSCDSCYGEPQVWSSETVPYYYCDNHKCPKSPKFRQYLLGGWEPLDLTPVGYEAGYKFGRDRLYPGMLM